MCFNAGPLDRALRISIGIGLIVYGLGTSNILLAVVGLVPLLTGAIGFCPFYPLLKINTGCKKD
ncbi:MAG: hypothetical protein ACI9TV_001110 [Sulfurimonas sp.]|jgi:hypothetical protein|uniref:YgaP family membrane protein n=1 Tax=Sulfurimonas sp. TaxID=2022749 RepID=UPI0039E29625